MSREIRLIKATTLGQCWLAVSRLVLEEGYAARYEGAPIKEIADLSLVVENPNPDDGIIQEHGDATWLNWMHENFFVVKDIKEHGNSRSYGARLFNYGNQGFDQIQWVIERLIADREARSATVTTFQPLTDTSHIPCISMLDYWMPEGQLEQVVYAHGLDFGKKAYGDLVELASLQHLIAKGIGCPVGPLIIHVKTAHIYEPEWEFMRQLVGMVPKNDQP